MMAQYSAYSQSIIAGYRMAAGQDLAEYLYATAGKGAFAPWLSPMGASVSDVLALTMADVSKPIRKAGGALMRASASQLILYPHVMSSPFKSCLHKPV